MAVAQQTKKQQKDAEAAAAAAAAAAKDAEEAEPTWDESLVEAIKKDSTRIETADGGAVEDVVSYLRDNIVTPGVIAAKKVKTSYNQLTRETGRTAEFMALARRLIILPSGLPDWGGTSDTYKFTISPIIDAAMGDGESRVTCQNRLQKSATRRLSGHVATYVLSTDKGAELGLDEEQAKVIIAQGEEVKEDDDNVKQFVALMNEQYRVGDANRGANSPMSPFEPRKQRAGKGLPTSDEEKGALAVKNLPSFRAGLKTVTLDLSSAEQVKIATEFYEVASGKSPQFGKGRKVVAENLFAAHVILYSTAKLLSEQPLTSAETKALEAAMGV